MRSFRHTRPNRPHPVAWLDHWRLSRRRALSLGMLWLLKPALLWGASDKGKGKGAKELISTLCDRLLPGDETNPGCRALGIDTLLYETFSSSREGRAALDMLATALDAEGFLDQDAAGQDEILHRHLTDGHASRLSLQLHRILDTVAKWYYADPRAWVALDYRKPQPHGYPDYADCPGQG